MNNKVKLSIDLCDSQFEKYIKDNGNLIIKIALWNNEKLEIIFEDTIRLLDNDFGDFVTIYNLGQNSDFINKAIDKVYEKKPEKHNYYHYQFKNIDDEIVLEVVSNKMRYATISNSSNKSQ
jgi:hypothetical protein